MKYITITSKHHDGFAMFDSKVSDYDIVDRDALRQGRAEDAGRRVPEAGHQAVLLPLAARLASSRLLPARPDGHASPAAPTRATGTATSTTWTRSCGELLTNYGDDRRDLVRRLVGQAGGRLAARPKTYELDPRPAARRARSAATTTGSRSPARTSRCSRRTCRARTPRASTTRPSSATLPLETCDTINDSWGYNMNDGNFKSTKQIMHYLVPRPGTTPTCC